MSTSVIEVTSRMHVNDHSLPLITSFKYCHCYNDTKIRHIVATHSGNANFSIHEHWLTDCRLNSLNKNCDTPLSHGSLFMAFNDYDELLSGRPIWWLRHFMASGLTDSNLFCVH